MFVLTYLYELEGIRNPSSSLFPKRPAFKKYYCHIKDTKFIDEFDNW